MSSNKRWNQALHHITILEQLMKQLNERGYARATFIHQVTNKLKCLEKKFHQVNNNIFPVVLAQLTFSVFHGLRHVSHRQCWVMLLSWWFFVCKDMHLQNFSVLLGPLCKRIKFGTNLAMNITESQYANVSSLALLQLLLWTWLAGPQQLLSPSVQEVLTLSLRLSSLSFFGMMAVIFTTIYPKTFGSLCHTATI